MNVFQVPSAEERNRMRSDGFLHVAVPTGIGDAHWSVMKLRALKELAGKPLCVHINTSPDHVTVGYLEMVPFIDRAITSRFAPYGLTGVDAYMAPRWGDLGSSAGWNGLDYLLQANGFVEQGINIRDWMPSLETEWDPELVWTPEDIEDHYVMMAEPEIVLYLSGTGPNRSFHNNWWSPDHWAQLIHCLNVDGHTPILVGADTVSDKGFYRSVAQAMKRRRAKAVSLIGKTSIPQYLGVISRCRIWVGLNSGGGIVSASMGTPTLMFWADRRFNTGSAHPGFDPKMQRSWIDDEGDPEKLETYHTMSYGSPVMTVDSVLNKIYEVMR